MIRVVQGLRSSAEQAAEWAKGRDVNGNIINESEVVTHAPPGHSWHEFGLAVDVAPFDEGIPDWNRAHPAWGRIVAVGESLGLTAGAEWSKEHQDWPHFQLTGRFPVSPDDEVRALFAQGGLAEVWKNSGLES
jgi:hypothetical protein